MTFVKQFKKSVANRFYNNEEEPEENELENSLIKVIDNRIYFYCEITDQSALELHEQLYKMQDCLAKTFLRGTGCTVDLYLNCAGGDVVDALSLADEIKYSQIPVKCIVQGQCVSAATLMCICAKYRVIKKNSFMMIHDISSVAKGKFSELADNVENAKMLREKIKKIYLTHTKIPAKKLNDLLKSDKMLDANQCVKLGLVDQID